MAQFQLSEAEFVRGSLASVVRRLTLVMIVIALGFLITSSVLSGRSLIHATIVNGSAAVGIVGFAYLAARRRLKKIFWEQQSLRELINVTIDNEKLSYSWVRGTYVLPWSDVRRWMETKNFFILFESTAFGRMIPKRALSPQEMDIVRTKLTTLPRR